MRPMLVALFCFSVLMASQNVLRVSPSEAPAPTIQEDLAALSTAPLAADLPGDPVPASVALLFVGLAGLTAAGNRRDGQARDDAEANLAEA